MIRRLREEHDGESCFLRESDLNMIEESDLVELVTVPLNGWQRNSVLVRGAPLARPVGQIGRGR